MVPEQYLVRIQPSDRGCSYERNAYDARGQHAPPGVVCKDELAHIHMTPGAGLARTALSQSGDDDLVVTETFKEDNVRLFNGGLAMLTDFVATEGGNSQKTPVQVAKIKRDTMLESIDAICKVTLKEGKGKIVYADDVITAHIHPVVKL